MQTKHRITGHLRLVHRAKGPVFYARIRTAERRDGRPTPVQRNVVIGQKSSKKTGAPAEGTFTERTAQRALDKLIEAEEAKAGSPQAAAGVTFAEAADEW